MAATQPTDADPTAEEKADACAPLDPRTVRALTEGMVVVSNRGWAADAPGLHLVSNEDGSEEYRVDTVTGSCTCPDFEYRCAEAGTECKHIRRAKYATGGREVPPALLQDTDGLLRRDMVKNGVVTAEEAGLE